MDFTRKKYSELLLALKGAGYSFLTFQEFMVMQKTAGEQDRVIVLRHDVDLNPGNSLAIAKLEHGLGIRASYYFRAVPQSWDEKIICEIADLGHELGYHYESLTTCFGDVDKAYDDFCDNLGRLRELVPVQTICMHGSPRSPWDSKDIWKKFDYKMLGICGEPYFDTDWSKVFYLTDTGRRWDGYKVSVRDKIPHWQDAWNSRGLVFHTTDDIIKATGKRELPGIVMITTHPQRWMPFGVAWLKEFLLQNIKNIVKRFFIGQL